MWNCFSKIRVKFVSTVLPLFIQELLGDLLISLMYQPSNNRIIVVVMKASKIKAMDITGTSGQITLFAVNHSKIQLDVNLYSLCSWGNHALDFTFTWKIFIKISSLQTKFLAPTCISLLCEQSHCFSPAEKHFSAGEKQWLCSWSGIFSKWVKTQMWQS